MHFHSFTPGHIPDNLVAGNGVTTLSEAVHEIITTTEQGDTAGNRSRRGDESVEQPSFALLFFHRFRLRMFNFYFDLMENRVGLDFILLDFQEEVVKIINLEIMQIPLESVYTSAVSVNISSTYRAETSACPVVWWI